VNPDPARGETGRTDNWTRNYAPNGDQHVMEKRTREGGKVNYELPEYLASKVISEHRYVAFVRLGKDIKSKNLLYDDKEQGAETTDRG